MLIEFRVANFRSFREEQTLSLVAGTDKTHVGNATPCGKLNLLKAAAIYGANASGKSNLVKAIRAFKRFIMISASGMNQGDPIPDIVPFRLDSASLAQPSVFEMTFATGEDRYQYGFSATPKRVYDEWLVLFPSEEGKRKQTWLERNYDAETGETEWHCRGPLKRGEQALRESTRENGLALSRGAQLNMEPLSSVFLCLRTRLQALDFSGPPHFLVLETACSSSENPHRKERLDQMVRQADFGIDGLRLASQPAPDVWDGTMSSDTFANRYAHLVSKMKSSEPGSKVVIETAHPTSGSDELQWFDMLEEESNGTCRFYALADRLLDAFEKGAVIVVDELDCSMHPLLTRKLVDLVHSPEANPGGGQLVFTTHDSSLMDSELFRRDQVWLVEKNGQGASELFSLYDFDTKDRPRNTEAFERNYLAGRYGGVPMFGRTFEDLRLP